MNIKPKFLAITFLFSFFSVTANSAPEYDVINFEINGLRLKMTSEEAISAITNYYNVPQSELKIKYIENPIGENASPLVTQIIFKNDDHKLTIKFTPVLIQADAAQAQVNRVSRRYNKDSNSVDNLLEKSIKEYGEYSTIDKKKYRKQKENRPGLSESEYQANYKHLWCTKISADNVEKCERGNDLALLRLGQRTLSLSTMIDVSQIQN